jgi:hypothetical protein
LLPQKVNPHTSLQHGPAAAEADGAAGKTFKVDQPQRILQKDTAPLSAITKAGSTDTIKQSTLTVKEHPITMPLRQNAAA